MNINWSTGIHGYEEDGNVRLTGQRLNYHRITNIHRIDIYQGELLSGKLTPFHDDSVFVRRL